MDNDGYLYAIYIDEIPLEIEVIDLDVDGNPVLSKDNEEE